MRSPVLAFILAAAATAAPCSAATLAGVSLPDSATVDGSKLVLNGIGLREATFLRIDVYVAGLYVPARSGSASALLEPSLPKRLVLRFVRHVTRDQIVDAFREGFAANSPGSAAALADRIAKLESWMADFQKGDEMALTLRPGTGVRVEVRGAERGEIPGDDFARAVFAIWLGPSPPTPELKKGLLGGA